VVNDGLCAAECTALPRAQVPEPKVTKNRGGGGVWLASFPRVGTRCAGPSLTFPAARRGRYVRKLTRLQRPEETRKTWEFRLKVIVGVIGADRACWDYYWVGCGLEETIIHALASWRIFKHDI